MDLLHGLDDGETGLVRKRDLLFAKRNRKVPKSIPLVSARVVPAMTGSLCRDQNAKKQIVLHVLLQNMFAGYEVIEARGQRGCGNDSHHGVG